MLNFNTKHSHGSMKMKSKPMQQACSALMVAAVLLFHREEREALGMSSRKSGNLCLRLWKWAIRRWGNAWTRLEYDMRSKPNDEMRDRHLEQTQPEKETSK